MSKSLGQIAYEAFDHAWRNNGRLSSEAWEAAAQAAVRAIQCDPSEPCTHAPDDSVAGAEDDRIPEKISLRGDGGAPNAEFLSILRERDNCLQRQIDELRKAYKVAQYSKHGIL